MRNNSLSALYLSKCDLVHKLALTNVNECPTLDKLSIQFSLKTNKDTLSSSTEMNTQIKGILLMYTLLGLNSKLDYRSEKNVIENLSKKNTSSYYIQKFILKNSTDIENFLKVLFVENGFKKVAQTIKFKKIKTGATSVNYTAVIPLSTFFEVNELCDTVIKDISTKVLNLQLCFFLKNCKNVDDFNFSVLPPFWHFG